MRCVRTISSIRLESVLIMSDDDLIRRVDARRILEEEGFLERSLANLNDLPAMQVAVKPLEWVEIRHGQYFEARVIGILYSVRLGTDAIARWQAGHMGTWRDAPTIEAAKAAAQADYDARIRSALTAQPSPDEHYDDYCIGQFAKMMSEKMAASRAKGRSGWNDPEKYSVEYLRSLLYEHLDKGDPVDVANFCMMLRHYEASTYREACNCQPQPSPDLAEARAHRRYPNHSCTELSLVIP